MQPTPDPLRFRQVATAERYGLSETWHHGAAAVVTPEGRLVARVGSEAVETFLRSIAKPFQAIPLVLGGGVERWDLGGEDLALVCASHQGTPAHTARVEALLARADLGEGVELEGVELEEVEMPRESRSATFPTSA